MEYRLRSIISPAWICSYESLSDFRRSASTLASGFERTGRVRGMQPARFAGAHGPLMPTLGGLRMINAGHRKQGNTVPITG